MLNKFTMNFNGVLMMNELIEKIEQWAEDRNIIKGSKPIDQAMKLFSEFGELADNVGKGRDCRDDIGDVFVVLTIIGKQTDIGMWESIKDAINANYEEDGCSDWDDLDLDQELIISFDELVENANEFSTMKQNIVELGSKMTDLFYIHDELNGEFDDYLLDCSVLLGAIAIENNTTLEECVQIAYNDIKDRKGVMYNGVFVKSTDPQYEDILKELGK